MQNPDAAKSLATWAHVARAPGDSSKAMGHAEPAALKLLVGSVPEAKLAALYARFPELAKQMPLQIGGRAGALRVQQALEAKVAALCSRSCSSRKLAKWVQSLQKLLANAEAARKSPRWVPDVSIERFPAGKGRRLRRCCMSCKKAFSLFVRIHHCRYCGWAVCDDCSTGRLVLDRWVSSYPPHTTRTVHSPDCETCLNRRARGQTNHGCSHTQRVCKLCVPHFREEKEERDKVYAAEQEVERHKREMDQRRRHAEALREQEVRLEAGLARARVAAQRKADEQQRQAEEQQRLAATRALAALKQKMRMEGLSSNDQRAVLNSGIKSVTQFDGMDDARFAACGVDIVKCRRTALLAEMHKNGLTEVEQAKLLSGGVASTRDFSMLTPATLSGYGIDLNQRRGEANVRNKAAVYAADLARATEQKAAELRAFVEGTHNGLSAAGKVAVLDQIGSLGQLSALDAAGMAQLGLSIMEAQRLTDAIKAWTAQRTKVCVHHGCREVQNGCMLTECSQEMEQRRPRTCVHCQNTFTLATAMETRCGDHGGGRCYEARGVVPFDGLIHLCDTHRMRLPA